MKGVISSGRAIRSRLQLNMMRQEITSNILSKSSLVISKRSNGCLSLTAFFTTCSNCGKSAGVTALMKKIGGYKYNDISSVYDTLAVVVSVHTTA